MVIIGIHVVAVVERNRLIPNSIPQNHGKGNAKWRAKKAFLVAWPELVTRKPCGLDVADV